MRRLSVILMLTALLACNGQKERDEAGEQALRYYQALIEERYDDFVKGMDTGKSIDDEYRIELEANARLFVERQQAEHGGIRSVRLVSSKCDSLSSQSFLVLCFGDSTNEQVVVPMVKRGTRWLMK